MKEAERMQLLTTFGVLPLSIALLTTTDNAQSEAIVRPQEAGLSSTVQQQIDVLLDQAVERKQVAGAVALLARDGKIAYLRASGVQDAETGK